MMHSLICRWRITCNLLYRQFIIKKEKTTCQYEKGYDIINTNLLTRGERKTPSKTPRRDLKKLLKKVKKVLTREMGSDKMLDVRDKRHGTEKVPRTLKTS